MLNIKGLCKSLPLKLDPILNNINFELRPGEFCVIIGNSGSGKTSLLKTIMGEYKADSGEIYLDSKSIMNLAIHKRAEFISSVMQNIEDNIVPEMTLLENFVISYLRDKTPSFRLYNNYAKQIYGVLAEMGLGLEKYLYKPLASFSLAKRQIISILMSMTANTKLLLLDEHTTALDSKTKLSLMKYIIEKAESQNITTLMVSQDFTDAIEYGDRLIILHHGKVAFDIYGNEKLSLTKDRLLRLLHSLEDKEGF